MKYSAIAISAFAVAVAAESKPQFLNSDFKVTEDKPFTLKYSGCDSGCTIILQDGPSSNLKDVKTLTTDASGSSTDVTLTDVPSGEYAFKIVDNSDEGSYNYSSQFSYEGTGSASSSATSKASTTSSSSSATTTSDESTTSTTASPTTTSATTPTGTTATRTTDTAATTGTGAPDSAAVRIDSSFALVAGAIAAMAYLN